MRDVAMPAVDPIERQMRLVRRRRNLLELQRGVYMLVAMAATSAAALVMLALVASERLFAAASWSLGAAVAMTGVLLARELQRRWVPADVVAHWIDTRANLRGRLTTLVAVRARQRDRRSPAASGKRAREVVGLGLRPRAPSSRPPEHDVEPAFMPLLAAENVARLMAWHPAALVRRAVPRAALAAALAATTALALAVMLAPRLRPTFPEIVYSDEPVDGAESGEQSNVTPSRIVVAPSHAEAARRHGRDSGPMSGGSDATDESRLAQLSSALQDRIRRDLWGREWERMRDAMAKTERAMTARAESRGTQRSTGAGDDADDGSEDAGDGWASAGPPSSRPGMRHTARQAGGDATARGHAAHADDADATARGLGDEESLTAPRAGHGEPAPGAGNETDPDLFGAPTNADPHGSTTFELAINAPVRAGRGAPRRPTGDAPAADTDAQPQLGRGTHDERAIRRMPVPASYEPIVREVFAHRDGTDPAP